MVQSKQQDTQNEHCTPDGEECARFKQRVRELEVSEARYQNLFEAVRDAIITLDRNGTVSQANPACAAILGFQPEQLIGKSLPQIFPLSGLPRLETAYQKSLQGESREVEIKFLWPTGKEVLLAMQLAPIRDDRGISGVLAMARDLTGIRLRELERSRLYEELQGSHRDLEEKALALGASEQQLKTAMAEQKKVNADLRELDRIKTDFIGIASHELRTPLTFLLGSLEYLQETLPERISDDEQSLLGYAMQGAGRLSDIVENMLNIARVEAEGFRLQRRTISFHDLLQEIRLELNWALGERQLELAVTPAEQWPTLLADPKMARRALEDVLENAIKYTADGGRIEVSSQVLSLPELRQQYGEQIRLYYPDFPQGLDWSGDFLEVMICDNGIGIASAEQPLIFQRFYSAGRIDEHSSSKTKFQGKGAGLGLALVKRIVHEHGGLAWAESPGSVEEAGLENPGSCFHLLFPLERLTAAESVVEEAVADRRPRILLVDDEPAIRRFVQVLLADEYELELASGGEEGLAMAVAFRPDLILLDLYMQGMDGFEVCKRLKQEPATKEIPVAMFTAVARKHEREKGLSVGAVDYITKPFFPRELLGRIKSLLSEYGFVLEKLNGAQQGFFPVDKGG